MAEHSNMKETTIWSQLGKGIGSGGGRLGINREPMTRGVFAGSSVALNLTRTSNLPPMLNPVGLRSIEAGRPASIVIQALDGDAQILHYPVTGDP